MKERIEPRQGERGRGREGWERGRGRRGRERRREGERGRDIADRN